MSRGFSIENYRKTATKHRINAATPKWVDSSRPKFLALFESIEKEFQRIQILISEASNKLSPSQRQIKSSVVCKMAGVTPSYLRADRKDIRPIHQYLREKNDTLNELWLKSKTLKNNSGRKLLKAELLKENKKLKQEIQAIRTKQDYGYFEQWVDNNVISDQKRLRAQISDLQARVAELEDEKEILQIDLKEARERALLPFKNR